MRQPKVQTTPHNDSYRSAVSHPGSRKESTVGRTYFDGSGFCAMSVDLRDTLKSCWNGAFHHLRVSRNSTSYHTY